MPKLIITEPARINSMPEQFIRDVYRLNELARLGEQNTALHADDNVAKEVNDITERMERLDYIADEVVLSPERYPAEYTVDYDPEMNAYILVFEGIRHCFSPEIIDGESLQIVEGDL